MKLRSHPAYQRLDLVVFVCLPVCIKYQCGFPCCCCVLCHAAHKQAGGVKSPTLSLPLCSLKFICFFTWFFLSSLFCFSFRPSLCVCVFFVDEKQTNSTVWLLLKMFWFPDHTMPRQAALPVRPLLRGEDWITQACTHGQGCSHCDGVVISKGQ